MRRERDGVVEVAVVLTSGCDAGCTYCYQDAKREAAMEWPVLRATLDLLIASSSPRRGVSFTGGEPTRRFALIERALAYARCATPPQNGVRFHLVTNGLRLGAREVALLASNDVTIDLSFDGVVEAQDARAPRTFARLDALLRLLGARHPDYLARCVTVSTTIARGTIPHLARSFDYFLSLGVRAVSVHPAIGQTEWSREDFDALDGQLSAIARASAQRYAATRRVPFTVFRRRPASRRPWARIWGCSAPLGRALAVDVDGQVFPCALMAQSYQRFSADIDARIRTLSLGDVRDPALPDRLASLPRACRASGLFEPKRSQHCGAQPCAGCRERGHCVVCPVARVKRPGEVSDLNDIPRYLCAYERLLAKHRRAFLAQAPRHPGEALAMRILRAVT